MHKAITARRCCVTRQLYAIKYRTLSYLICRSLNERQGAVLVFGICSVRISSGTKASLSEILRGVPQPLRDVTSIRPRPFPTNPLQLIVIHLPSYPATSIASTAKLLV
jgi:hypothetical protein